MQDTSGNSSLAIGQGRSAWWLAAGVMAVALAVYVATLAPSLSFEHNGTDGGDLVAAAWNLGVPHPSGYPTYTLLAWLLSRLPLGTIAYRVNLLSALCAAGAVGLTFLTAQLLLPGGEHPVLLPAATALSLAFSSLLWSQAVITEVYALLAFFAALLLWLLIRWRQGGGDLFLWLAGLSLGLGLGNHLTLVFIVPPAFLLLWSERRRWFRPRALLPTAGLFLAGLCIYVYLPLAARHGPPVNWGNPQTWDRFLWVVTGHQYQAFAFGLDPGAMPERLGTWAWLLGDQFGWWGLALALAGGWWWWQRDRALALFGLAWALLAAVYAFFYDTGDSQVYLLPVMLLLALGWLEGARGLLRLAKRWLPAGQRLAAGLLLLLPLISLGLHWAAADPDDDWQVDAYIDQALANVPPGGLVLVRGDRATFALWYGLYVEGQRPDVAVVNGPLLAYIWYRDEIRRLYPDLIVDEPTADNVTIDDLARELIADNLPRRSVLATDPGEGWKDGFAFDQVSDAPLYRAEPQP